MHARLRTVVVLLGAFLALDAPFRAAADDASDFDGLIRRVAQGDPKDAAEAADALVAAGASAVPRLCAALTLASGPTGDADERGAVLRVLGRIAADHDEAVPPLGAALSDGDPKVREAAARGLLAAGPRAKPQVEALTKALADGFKPARLAAAAALLRSGAPGDAAVAALVAGAKDPDAAVRAETAGLLASSGAAPSVVETVHLGGALRGDRLRRARLAKSAGSSSIEPAVSAAIDWLARHQADDGGWSAESFDVKCVGDRCDGAGLSQFDVGVTGLALLAFLGAGETQSVGPHREVVARAIASLRSRQDASGRLGNATGDKGYAHGHLELDRRPNPRNAQVWKPVVMPRSDGMIYDHLVAAVALAEDYMLTLDPTVKEAAQRAADFTTKAKNSGLAWRYNVPPDGDNDTSVTAWAAWGLAVADAAGLQVERAGLKDSVLWIDKMTEPEYGRVGYQQRGGPCMRLERRLDVAAGRDVEVLTAKGVLVRFFAGGTRKSSEFVGKGADLVAKKPPVWDFEAGTVDFYGWFWGATAMRQFDDRARPWFDGLRKSLVENQRKDAKLDSRGSWDPIDVWGDVGGRVYSTAMAAMALEAWWRMDVFADGK